MSHRLAHFKFRLLRVFARTRKGIAEFWHQNSGEWSWVTEKPRSITALSRNLWKASVPSLGFYVLSSLSSVISTLGLLSGSVATVIGAMIIAPLMGPIIGMAYAIVVSNRRLLKRSSLTTVKGVILSIVVSILITYLLGLRTPNPEILARTQPSLIDLGVALAAGAAGAFAQSRRSIINALPGVAIAVALVPPLSVIGIGLAWSNPSMAWDATVLFATNLIGIVLSGCLVFLSQGYGSLDRARRGLLAGSVVLLFLILPLGLSLRNILIRENVKRQISSLIRRQTLTFAGTEIETVVVRPLANNTLLVELTVAAKPGTISQQQVKMVRDFLSTRLDQPVRLTVRIVPTEIFEE